MPDLFDSCAGAALKADGMEVAALNRHELLDLARRIAVEIARSRFERTCTADDVARELERRGFGVHALRNSAGSLFTNRKIWQWTGRRIKSERKHAHQNEIKVWQLIGG